MRLHRRAATCPNSRALIARRVDEEGWSLRSAAEAAGVSEPTARKWVCRFLEQGRAGLQDRSSTPHSIPHKTAPERVQAIAALRRLRMTAAEIAELLSMALATVSLWLKRIGLGKRSRLEPPEPPNRYERRRPGELVHVDVKKLARISVRGAGHRVTGHRRSQIKRGGRGGKGVTGFEFVHVCIDDATRLAYAEVLGDERTLTAIGFFRRALAWFREHGVRVERVMSDNGSCYRSRLHAIALAELGIRHLRTRPYRPRTNGKAERFIQTLVGEWAHGRIYGSPRERTSQLAPWLLHYNFRRPHGALGHRPPGARLGELNRNDLVGNYN